jgi:hypothetical protein
VPTSCRSTAQKNKRSFPSLARRSEKRSPSPPDLGVILKDYRVSYLVKESKKAAELKMVTVDQYMEENQLNEMEFRQQLFNRRIQIVAWVSDLLIVHFWPNARYQIKNLDLVPWYNKTGYVDLFLPNAGLYNQGLANGLIGLSLDISLSVINNGSVELSEGSVKRDIFITKHTVFMNDNSGSKCQAFINPKGVLPNDIQSNISYRRNGQLYSYQSSLFEDFRLRDVVADIIPGFDFRAWKTDETYRENNSGQVKSTFETVIDEHKFIPESLLDRRAYVPVNFEKDKLLSEVTSLPDVAYRIEAEDFKALKSSRRGDTFEPNQFRLEVKVPPPVISRSQLIVFDVNEDMYSLTGEDENISLQDDLEPVEVEDEGNYQSELYIREKRLLILKGWLGASEEIDTSKPLVMTTGELWEILKQIDKEVFPPASKDTIKSFFQFQNVCHFKLGRPAGK